MQAITKEMVTAWKNDVVTKEVLAAIQREMAVNAEVVMLGGTLGDNSAVDTAEVIGRYKAYDHCMTIFEELDVVEDDE